MSEKASHFVFLDRDYETVNRGAIRSMRPDWLLIKILKLNVSNGQLNIIGRREVRRREKLKKKKVSASIQDLNLMCDSQPHRI